MNKNHLIPTRFFTQKKEIIEANGIKYVPGLWLLHDDDEKIIFSHRNYPAIHPGITYHLYENNLELRDQYFIYKNKITIMSLNEVTKKQWELFEPFSIKWVDHISYKIEFGYYILLEDLIETSKAVYLYFLSLLKSKKNNTVELLQQELTYYLLAKNISLSKPILIGHFDYLGKDIYTLKYFLEKGGLSIPFSVTMGMTGGDIAFKEFYDCICQSIKDKLTKYPANSPLSDFLKDIHRNIETNNYILDARFHGVTITPITTFNEDIETIDKEDRLLEDMFYFIEVLFFYQSTPIFISNLYLYKKGVFKQEHPCSNFLLEID